MSDGTFEARKDQPKLDIRTLVRSVWGVKKNDIIVPEPVLLFHGTRGVILKKTFQLEF